MADDKRDVQLRVSAVDVNSKKTFKEVSTAINGVTSSLDEQLAAAKRGQVSTQQLTNTLKTLKSANDALLKQQGVVDLFHRQAGALEAAEKRSREAAAAVQAQREALAGLEKPTRDQTRELARLETAERNAAKAVEQRTRSLADQENTLRELGIYSDDMVQSQRMLAAASAQVGAAYRATETALDGYAEAVNKTRAAEARLAEEETFQRKLDDARKLREASQYIQFWTNALTEADAKERAYAAQQAQTADSIARAAERRNAEAGAVSNFRAEAERNRVLQERARYVLDITAALDAQEAQERQLAALNTFRVKADEADATVLRMERLATATQQAVPPTASLASSLRQIIQPGSEAVKTLDGLEAKLREITSAVGEADGPIRDYQDAINDLGRVQTALLRQADMIDGFRNQEEAVKRAEAAFAAARADVERYAAEVRAADEPNEELAASLARAEGALGRASNELSQQRTRLETLRGSLKAATIDTNNLSVAEGRLKTASEGAAATLRKLDAASSGRNSGAGRFLGLRPYELQNLSFQINDVFTQLASGTSITQTFAQQGGQIAQLFPRVFAVFLNPAVAAGIVAVTAVLLPLFAALRNTFDLASSAREFEAAMTLSAGGAQYSAEALAEAAHQLDVYGTSLKNARASVAAFVKEGLDEDQIVAFGRAAQNLAEITGEAVPEAAGRLAQSFSRGWEDVKRLDDSMKFLTRAEREQIKALFDSGQAYEARSRAFRIFEQRVDDAAEKSRNAWSRAFRAITNVWDSFLQKIGESQPIKDAVELLERAAEAAQNWANSMPGSSGSGWGLPGGIQRAPTVGGFDGASLVTGDGPYAGQNRAVAHGLFSLPSWTRPEWMGGQPGATSQGNVVLTPELRDVAAMAYLEAINDPQAQRDVAAVIVNRVRGSNMNASQVVRAPGQFEPYNARRSEFDRVRNDDRAVLRVLENILPILEGAVADPTNGATLFVSPQGQRANGRSMPAWADPNNLTLERYGHQFYTGAFPGQRGGARQSQQGTAAGTEELAKLTREIELREKNNDQLRIENAEREARERILAAQGTQDEANLAASRAGTEERRKIAEETRRELESIQSTMQQIEGQASRATVQPLEDRLRQVDERVNKAKAEIDKLQERNGLSAAQRAELEAAERRLVITRNLLREQETMKFYEESIAALEDQRAERLRQISQDADAGRISSAEAFRQASEVTSQLAPQIKTLADNARDFAKGINEARPDPRLQQFITQMERTSAGTQQGGDRTELARMGQSLLAEEQGRLNAILSERNSLVQTYNDLTGVGGRTATDTVRATAEAYQQSQPAIDAVVDRIRALLALLKEADAIGPEKFAAATAGLQQFTPEAQNAQSGQAQIATREKALNDIIQRRNELVQNYGRLVDSSTISVQDAQALTQQAFEQSQPLIQEQVDAMKALLDTQRELGVISPEVYGVMVSRLQAVSAEAVYVSENFTRIREGLDSAFIGAATTAIQGLAQMFADLEDGTLKWGDSLETIRDLALSFAADFLQSLAEMLLQMALLQAVQSLPFFNKLAGAGAGLFDAAPLLLAAPLLSGAGTQIQAAGATLTAAAVPLGVVAAQLQAAAAAMSAAASLQIAANSVSLFHGGGIIGKTPTMRRTVNPAIFAGAPRFHSGTVVGLRPDEQAAILQKGEEVLDKDNPRNILNGGAAAGGGGGFAMPEIPAPIVNNYIDPGEMIEAGLRSKRGKKAFMNVIDSNKRAVNEKLGS